MTCNPELSSAGRTQLAVPTPVVVPECPEMVHELFDYQVTLRPSAIAVVCGSNTLTYAELNRRADKLAHYLKTEGFGRGTRVGLLLPRSADVYIAMLGILKAGATYVPLDPDYPPERVRFILSDCGAGAVITSRHLAHKAASSGARRITLDGQPSSDERYAMDLPLASSTADAAVVAPRRSLWATVVSGFRNHIVTNAAEGTNFPPGLSKDTDQSHELSSRSGATESGDKKDFNKGTLRGTGASSSDPCYIIYTSGTTGQPKGVEVEHRSVCHLARVTAELFQVTPSDRVYQGYSIAFDASVSEIWLAFSTGATLVAATQEMTRAGAKLPELLAEAGVTIFSSVPTLLTMMTGDVPSARLIFVGGEPCSPELVKRWCKPGRRFFNVYGPTEATVIATYAECFPDRPVTIGQPLPKYTAFVLDEDLQAVPRGASGELCLGGVGLARGYVGRPELTQEKFITFTPKDGSPQRLYRTGDLVRWNDAGDIEFLGRIDAQVKIRGFRVELGEIEAALAQCPGIKASAVALHESSSGVQQLIGYVVTADAGALAEEKVRALLRERLPPYMIPALFETLSELPTLPSGKVDRKRLPAPKTELDAERVDVISPCTDRERQIAAVWESLFKYAPISVDDNFFLNLGGHSLLAARMVSQLRRSPDFESLSTLDVYKFPTVESLARELEDRAKAASDMQTATPSHRLAVPFWRHFLCGAAQFVSLVFTLGFCALHWIAPYLTFTILDDAGYISAVASLGAFASLIVFYPVMLAFAIAAKWIIIGRYRPGSYPLWGTYYFRWWLVQTIEATVPSWYLTGTPLMSIYLRLMGARIGRNVRIHSDNFAIYDLLSIADDSSVNVDSSLLGYTVEDGFLKIGRITIGQNCFIGVRAALREDVTLEDGSALEDLSLLPRGATVPRGETWLGSPAQPVTNPIANGTLSGNGSAEGGDCCNPSAGCPSDSRRIIFAVLQALGVLIFPVLVVAALFPGIILMHRFDSLDAYCAYLLLAPLVGLSFVILLCLEIAALKWLLLGRIKPGRYSLHSSFYLRKWFFDQTMDLSLDVLGPLYETVFLAPWYRLLGAKVGHEVEISTASSISPDLLSLEDESFVADLVSLGAPRVRDGFMTIGKTCIGRRSFIGNSALVPAGTVIGDGVLVGCLSASPSNPADALRKDAAWLGSPPVFLPQRQVCSGFGEEATFAPSRWLRAQRLIIELFRVTVPITAFIVQITLLIVSLLWFHGRHTFIETLIIFPILYFISASATVAATVLAKWALVGRYRPCEKPFWSHFVWRNELLNALHDHLAEPLLVDALRGTPFVCWYFRLLGARIGRRVYMETTDLTEYDLVSIGDEAALNSDCTVQTHLFEDRVMKCSTVAIGPRCNVGASSLVLYDAQMEEGSSLADLSLILKGESLPPGVTVEGIPAQPKKPAMPQRISQPVPVRDDRLSVGTLGNSPGLASLELPG
jgi:non-ribosomal peptide synthetase-like protein